MQTHSALLGRAQECGLIYINGVQKSAALAPSRDDERMQGDRQHAVASITEPAVAPHSTDVLRVADEMPGPAWPHGQRIS